MKGIKINNIEIILRKSLIANFLLLITLTLNAQKKWSLEYCFSYAMGNNLEVIAGNYNKDIQAQNLTVSQREYLSNLTANFNNNLQLGTIGNTQNGRLRNDIFSNNLSLNTELLIFNAGKLKKNIKKMSMTYQRLIMICNKLKIK